MLGYSHAVSGSLAWLATAPLLSESVFKTELNPTTLAAGAVVTAGAALLPDLDHPQATIAHTFGDVSKSVAVFTEKTFGGHRNGTHSLLFALGSGVITQLIVLSGWRWGILGVVFIFTAFAIRGLNLTPPTRSKFTKTLSVIVFSALITWLLSMSPDITSWVWLGPAVFLGSIVHCLGDSLTPQRVPWLWPKKKRYGFPIISKTGNSTEKVIITPIMLVATLILVWFLIVQPLLGSFSS